MKRAQRLNDIETYYFAKKLVEIKEMVAAGHDVINLGIGSPDLAPPKTVVTKLAEVSKLENVNGYQSYWGIPELRLAFAKWYDTHFSIKLNHTNEILPLIGSKEGIMHISMAFLNPGDLVLVPNPGYPAYQTISKICGAEVKQYSLNEANNYLPNISELKSMNLDKVKIMWLNYPHMPTGSSANQGVFDELVLLAKQHDFLLCLDNPYAFILNDKATSLFKSDPEKQVSIELTSLSKHYNMAGWRVGAAIASSEHIKHIMTFKSNMDSGMYKGIQFAAIEALSLDQSWFDQLNEVYRERRNEIFVLFDKLKCQYQTDKSGLFVWAKIPADKISGESYSDEILKQQNTFITPGFIFGSEGDRFLRASLCQPVEVIKKAQSRCK